MRRSFETTAGSPRARDGTKSTGVKSAGRTLDILELLARTSRPVSHADVATRTLIPKSSLTQLLRTLESRGYVESLGDGGPFRLGRTAHLLGYGVDVQGLVARARPAMESLTEQASQSSALNLLKGDVVERAYGITALHGIAVHEGVRAPLYASSAGKLFLAHMSPSEVEQYFERVELRPLARRSIRSLGELHRQIRNARAEQVAYSQDEFTDGVVGLSAPVLDAKGIMVAAIGLAVPTPVFLGRRASLIRALQHSALSASASVAAVVGSSLPND